MNRDLYDEILEMIYREVSTYADANGVTFTEALAGIELSPEERADIVAYARREYGL